MRRRAMATATAPVCRSYLRGEGEGPSESSLVVLTNDLWVLVVALQTATYQTG